MSPAALLPMAIPGLSRLAAGAARAVSEGLSFAATLADGGQAPTEIPPVPAKPQLPSDLQKQIGEFAAKLREKLAGLGTSLSSPVELSADVLGGIRASGDEQDAEAVQKLLGHDQELSSAFFQLAAAFKRATGQVNAAETSLPWDTAGAARGVKMVVGESGGEFVAN